MRVDQYFPKLPLLQEFSVKKQRLYYKKEIVEVLTQLLR